MLPPPCFITLIFSPTSLLKRFMAAHDIHPLLTLKTIRRMADMEMRQAGVVSSATVSGLPC